MGTAQRALKLLFSINSGRAGSQYLARILGTAQGVHAFHEAEPQMTGVSLKMINEQPYEQTYHLRRFKADAIREYCAAGDQERSAFLPTRVMAVLRGPHIQGLMSHHLIDNTSPLVYADTSHMFIKTFQDVVVREFPSVGVIILRRKLPEVLKSFIELSYFHENKTWADWMSSPNAATAAIRCIDTDHKLDHYDKCIAYLIDMEARANRFKREHPGIRTHEVTVYDLNSRQFIERFFADLGILPTRRTYKIVGEPVNQKQQVKASVQNWTTIDYCKARIQNYIAKAHALGIDIPQTLLL